MKELIEYVGKGAFVGIALAAVLVTAVEVLVNLGRLWFHYTDFLSSYLGAWGQSFAVISPFFTIFGAYLGFDMWNRDSTNTSDTGENDG